MAAIMWLKMTPKVKLDITKVTPSGRSACTVPTVAMSVSSPSRARLKASVSTRTMQESTVVATGTLAVSASADASVKGTTAYDGSDNELTGVWRSPKGTNAW